MFVIITTANFIAKLKCTFSLWNTINYFMLTEALRNFPELFFVGLLKKTKRLRVLAVYLMAFCLFAVRCYCLATTV